MNSTHNDVTEAFINYCRPLIQGEPAIITEDGIPKHISLQMIKEL